MRRGKETRIMLQVMMGGEGSVVWVAEIFITSDLGAEML